jgi:hypothetical protein
MTVYAQTCTFPGSAPIQDATNGWDAVYAVAYSTINDDLAQRKPWVIDFGGAANGTFDAGDGTDYLNNAQISGISLVTGGAGSTVLLNLNLTSAELQLGSGQTFPLTNLVVPMEATLVFVADPTTPGLHNLTVNTAAGLTTGTVSGTVTGTPPSPDTPLTVTQATIIQALLQTWVNEPANTAIFTGVFANVFTKDYAESVNIPWLMPTAFDYAVADMATPSTDGILAVLASVSGNVVGLSAQVEPLVFPTNSGINAAAIISSQTVADNTFLQELNSQIGAALSAFSFDASQQLLSNTAAISAFYCLDSTSGQLTMIPASEVATATGPTYPVNVPIGGLTISFADNSIVAAITDAVVDLGNGYTQTLTMSSTYQLVVDPGTQDVDMVLYGSPVVTSSVTAPPTSSVGDILENIGITGVSIAFGELFPLAVDYLGKTFTNIGTSAATLQEATLQFYAAERQMRQGNGNAVTFSISGGRRITVAPTRALLNTPALPLDPNFVQSVTLSPIYRPPEDDGDVNDTNANLNPGNASQPGGVSLAYEVYATVWSFVRGSSARAALRASCQKAGFSQTDAFMPPRGPATVNATAELSAADEAALYEGCINYVIAATKSGNLSATLYGRLVTNFPEATANSAIAEQFGGNSSFASGDSTQSINIATSPGGIVTSETVGMFGDLRAAAGTGRVGLGQLVIQDIILNAPRPLWVKLTGIAFYAAGLVGGLYLSNLLDAKLNSLQPSATDVGNTASGIASGGPGGPASLLFANVSFPFMTRFQSGTTTGPTPESVLQAAAVNGGLVLGVSINLNLN